MDIQLCIRLQNPPEGVDFGIQKGSGTGYETIQTQRSDGLDIQFNLTIQLKSDPQKINEPRFSGPFVQGKPASQFLYIDVGEYAGQVGGWSRRVKIPLSGVTWDMITQLSHHPTAFLITSFPGTTKDGSPICATVKPFEGWKVNMP
ncbi:DUF5990 family protein [Mucilaginibacter sp. P19]|uniref:Uncharacterized protein n=1 Tax=Mucilaginibacter gossypii TaxID=551996 RepID=A0A1G7XR21_9SPHI|nr:DUF5990 family protein [Mucilaginibacter gossypii]SDG86614.1 hypothetical protein SAMN05192573_105143 [Mucilaginibacter gossypii]